MKAKASKKTALLIATLLSLLALCSCNKKKGGEEDHPLPPIQYRGDK